ncbi:MAG: hypothetical protein KH704_09560 [Clostridiales bacterium]|nr:hypothetical protein [Clostridiales bacterium]
MSAQKQTPFQTIEQACKTTGLSMYYLRRGCWDGTVPHVKSGRVYYINIPALLRSLGATTEESEPAQMPDKVTDIRAAGRKKARA